MPVAILLIFFRAVIADSVKGYLSIFFALQRNEVSVVSMLLNVGANLNARCKPGGVPILGFAIFHAEYEVINPSEVVKTLLAMGAKPYLILKDMWEDYLEKPNAVFLRDKGTKNPTPSWCVPEPQEYSYEKSHTYSALFSKQSSSLKVSQWKKEASSSLSQHHVLACGALPYRGAVSGN